MPSPASSAYGHLQVISRQPHRRAGTPEFERAAAYVLRCFRAWGYTSDYHEFSFPFYELQGNQVTVQGGELPSFPIFYSGTTDAQGVSGVLTGATGNLSGKVALARGDEFSQVYAKAVREGAVAVIRTPERDAYYTQNRIYGTSFRPVNWGLGRIPALICEGTEGRLGQTVTVVNRARLLKGKGRNIVAVKPGYGSRYILVTAHLDSWFNGACDDGTGVAALLEIARSMQGTSTRHGIIFLVCDSEELGLAGSAAFIRDTGPEEIACVLEMDMISSLASYFPDLSMWSIPPFLVSNGSLAPYINNWTRRYPGWEIPFPTLLAQWFISIRTDYRWYWERQVPGLFVNTLTAFYHTPDDTIDTVDPVDLANVTAACEGFVRDIARAGDLGRAHPVAIEVEAAQVGTSLELGIRTIAPGYSAEPVVEAEVYSEGCYLASISLTRTGGSEYAGSYPLTASGALDVLVSMDAGWPASRWVRVNVDLP